MKDIIEEKQMFQHIFESSMGGIIVVDTEGKIILANDACCSLFGYNSKELLNKNIEILIPVKLKDRYLDFIAGKFIPFKESDVYGVKKNGRKINVSIGLNPTSVNGKKVTMIFALDATQHADDAILIKQTNKKLKDSKRKFHSLISNLKGIIFRCKNNQNLDMDFISEGCMKITGYHFTSFINGTVDFAKLILEQDRNEVWNKKKEAIKNRTQYDVEYRIYNKNGEIRYVLEKGEAIYNENYEVKFLEGFISDITALKVSMFDLHKSEAKTKALLEAIPDTILIQDREGRYLDWYANSPEISFMPPERFLGLTMEEALPESVYRIVKKSHDKVIETGTMQLAEYSFPVKNKILYHEARVVLMNDHSLLTIIRDVTQKKLTDDMLRIRNNALASAINSIVISDAINPEIPIIYSNCAFEKMTGYSNEEVIGKNCQFLQNDDRDQKSIDIMHNSIANGEACNVTLRNYKKDGTLFWNNVTITPIFNDQQVVTHFVGIQSDVTNKVKAEKLKDQTQHILELMAKDKPLEIIADSVSNTIKDHIKNVLVSVLLFDCEQEKFNIVIAPKVESLLNLKKVLSDSNADFAQMISFFKESRVIENFNDGRVLKYYKELAFNNDVKTFWSFPIRSSSKQILGVIAIFSGESKTLSDTEKEIIGNMADLISIPIEKGKTEVILHRNKIELEKYAHELEVLVQERTQEVMATVQKLVETNFILEEQVLLAQNSEKLARTSRGIASEIAKNFPDGFVAVIDQDLKIIFLEGEGLKQLALEKIFYEGGIIGKIPNSIDAPQILMKDNVIRTQRGERLSFEVKFKDRYFVVNTLPLIDDNNQIYNSLHVYSDITLQKEAEFNIKKSLTEERELNSLKSRFISMASHEFRTPLSAILTSAILIMKQNQFEDKLKREKYVLQIEKNVNHLIAILNDFLSLSKLDEGELVSVPQQFDLVSFSKDFLQETLIGLKEEQSFKLNVPDHKMDVFLDQKLLSHILNNLLSNAAKYSAVGSEISLKVTQLQHSFTIEVSDTGIGIPKTEQIHVFSRFFRANNALNIEGTGLGLHIVKQYVTLMGGAISFKTEINKGASFLIEFPNT
ncbi:PAS domain S-box protein [Flavobacterium sp. PL12]|uniref:PAS domain S-box protein n=1 Tax=Flavobacterium sp. PL12 TaxID=3071718 RepID=UPI00319E8C8B